MAKRNAKGAEECPHCGRCKHCGRRDAAPSVPLAPYYPYPYYFDWTWRPWLEPWYSTSANTGSVTNTGPVTTSVYLADSSMENITPC